MLWRCVGKEAGRSLGGVRRERGGACEQHNNNIQGWTGMSENLEGEKRAPDWSNDGMDSVPDRINPGNFICEKFEQKKNAGNKDRKSTRLNSSHVAISYAVF